MSKEVCTAFTAGKSDENERKSDISLGILSWENYLYSPMISLFFNQLITIFPISVNWFRLEYLLGRLLLILLLRVLVNSRKL